MSEISDDLMRELMQSFKVESVEHLEILNQSLLQLERAEDEKQRKELIQESFRAAHSLKGAARAVNLEMVETLSSALESVLHQARETNTVPEADVCDVMYEILDAIQAALDGQEVDGMALRGRLADANGEEFEAIELALDDEDISDNVPDDKLAEPSQETVAENGFKVISEDTIRVAVSKLDTLMAQSGELVVSKISAEQRLSEFTLIREQLAQWPRAWREIQVAMDRMNGQVGGHLRDLLGKHYDRLQSLSRSMDTLEQALHSDTVRLGMTVDDLQDDIRRVRMLPLQTIALGLERAVRDAARVENKQVAFSVEGGDVELDKKVLEMLKDPLLHLLRNAVSHGIETPTDRQAADKPAEGRVRLSVRQRGSEVSLIVSDDGHGFDMDALRQAGNNSDDGRVEDSLSLAFLPGVTTSKEVTAISGRGVGLDVVRQQIETLHGRIAVDSAPGQGSTIELIVPTSLAMTRALLVRVGAEQFALPLLSIERIVDVADTFFVSGKQMINVNETPLPLVPLAGVLERPLSKSEPSEVALAVIVSVAEQRLALEVDDIVTELELAVKSSGSH